MTRITAHHRRATRRAQRGRVLVAVCTIVACLVAGLPGADRAVAAPTDPVVFADLHLQAAVNAALGDGPFAVVTEAEAATIGSLDASFYGFSDLGGIEFLTNLYDLDLTGNEIVDVSPLSGLTGLETLGLSGNEVADVSPLAGLANLTDLRLSSNPIVDVSPLAGLTSLTVLYLGFSEVVDVSPLAGLTNLTVLYLSNSEVVDVLPLAGLTNLTDLGLSNSEVVDVLPLAGLANLTYLGLSDNQVVDVSPLSGLTNLTDLDLRHNQVADVSPLAGHTNLTYLGLSYNHIVNVSPLAGLTNLTDLSLYFNQIVNVSPLAGLTNLTELSLGYNQIVDVSPLAGLTNLTYLSLASQSAAVAPALVGDLTGNPVVDEAGNPVSVSSVDAGFSYDSLANMWSFSTLGQKSISWSTTVTIGSENSTFAGGVAQTITGDGGLLRVTTSPAVPSQITVDGHVADTWGLEWVELPAGSHEVCFSDVAGYATPPCETVEVTAGQTTTVDGAFTQRGYLHVTTSPAVAAQISIDGHPADNWGLWTSMDVGMHQVCFGAVENYDPPACQNVNVTAGVTTDVAGAFTSNPAAMGQSGVGMLRVTTSPAVPSRITVDGHASDAWGLEWLEIAPGSHEVCFGDVAGYGTPACETVSVSAGATTTVNGVFTKSGTLKVTSSPAVAGTIYVDGIPRDAWGVWTEFETGNHQVCFGDVPGHTAPACQSAVITAGNTTQMTGMYT